MFTGILEWQNELSLATYPLNKDVGLKTVLIDAKFQQFDSFIPVLVSITTNLNNTIWRFLTDEGVVDVTVPNSSLSGDTFYLVGAGWRNLGWFVVGAGLPAYVNKNLNQVIKYNIPFSVSSVVSIPSSCGVYSIESLYGNVHIGNDLKIFFNLDTGTETLTWNAASAPNIASGTSNPLLSLNGVTPTANAVQMEDSEVIKIQPINGGLNLSLASSVLNNTIIPTIIH